MEPNDEAERERRGIALWEVQSQAIQAMLAFQAQNLNAPIQRRRAWNLGGPPRPPVHVPEVQQELNEPLRPAQAPRRQVWHSGGPFGAVPPRQEDDESDEDEEVDVEEEEDPQEADFEEEEVAERQDDGEGDVEQRVIRERVNQAMNRVLGDHRDTAIAEAQQALNDAQARTLRKKARLESRKQRLLDAEAALMEQREKNEYLKIRAEKKETERLRARLRRIEQLKARDERLHRRRMERMAYKLGMRRKGRLPNYFWRRFRPMAPLDRAPAPNPVVAPAPSHQKRAHIEDLAPAPLSPLAPEPSPVLAPAPLSPLAPAPDPVVQLFPLRITAPARGATFEDIRRMRMFAAPDAAPEPSSVLAPANARSRLSIIFADVTNPLPAPDAAPNQDQVPESRQTRKRRADPTLAPNSSSE